MTFLNSLFLFALPLIAVPLLLHFLKRREQKVVHWGAMRFLQEASTESRRMRLPESLLLLLTRCLLVSGLVFALARPLIHWGGVDKVSDRELIVIVDDSLSTARQFNGGQVFAQIRDAAENVISDSPKDLPVQVMLASGGGRWIGEQPQSTGSSDGKMALKELVKLRPTLGTANLMDCVQKAISAANDRETTTRPRPAQRIVVVTDGTTPAWYGSERRLQRMKSTIEQSKLPVQIQVLEVESAPDQFRNLSVVQLDSESDRVGVKESVRLHAVVQNTGAVASVACRLAWKVNDKVKGHTAVSELAPGESTQVVWSTKFKSVGPVAVEGALEQDQTDHLPEDSSAIKVIEVVDQIPILLIDNESESGTADQQSQQITFLTLALGYEGEEANNEYHSIFSPTIIPTSEVGSEDLSAYSAIIVAGTKNDSSELSELLLPEVRRGCGVWILVDSKPDVDAFNENWFQDGVGLSPLPLVDAAEESTPDADLLDEAEIKKAEVRIHPPSTRHPATRVLSDQQRIDLDQVTLQKHAFFQPLLLGDEVSIPLQSNRGAALVVENTIGKGRVLVQSFPISLDATNWPVTNSFVVMVHEWVEYLAQPSTSSFNLAVGSPLVWQYEDRPARPELLCLPDGTKIDLTEDAQAHGLDRSAGTFRYFATRLPGLYRARPSAQSEGLSEVPFYIPPNREELLALPMSNEDRYQLTDIGGFDLANTSKDLDAEAQTFWSQQDTTSSTSGGQPIWQWIVLALLGLVLFELLLAGRVGRQRCGDMPSNSQHLNPMQQLSGRQGTNDASQARKSKRKTASVG